MIEAKKRDQAKHVSAMMFPGRLLQTVNQGASAPQRRSDPDAMQTQICGPSSLLALPLSDYRQPYPLYSPPKSQKGKRAATH